MFSALADATGVEANKITQLQRVFISHLIALGNKIADKGSDAVVQAYRDIIVQLIAVPDNRQLTLSGR